jgi:hypothetical protein
LIYEYRWLDIEKIYEDFGWIVEYEKPSYCEDFPATFKFSKKEK